MRCTLRRLAFLLSLFPLAGMWSSCNNRAKVDHAKDSLACTRLSNYRDCLQVIDTYVWPGVLRLAPPILYFTEQLTYAYGWPEDKVGSLTGLDITCSGSPMRKLDTRWDEIPFHMEVKMDLDDTASVIHRYPVMFCSSPELMVATIKDFTSTEDWLLLVAHEHFHAFQFSHQTWLDRLANEIRYSADTLQVVYSTNPRLAEGIRVENEALLEAIHAGSASDRATAVERFLKAREERREKFGHLLDGRLAQYEDFWEATEGSSRYVEYGLGLQLFRLKATVDESVDPIHHGYADYSDPEVVKSELRFREREQLLAPYFYVTGFNMCRILDSLGVDYKEVLFSTAGHSLYEHLKSATLE